MTDSNDSHLPEDRLPDAIVNELRRSDQVPFDVPPERTAGILGDAHEYLVSRSVVRPPRRWLRITVVVSSVCAALLVFMVTEISDTDQRSDQSEPMVMEQHQLSPDSKDIDENGVVDILDAYAMARLLESGEPEGRWDFNSDGELNEDDVRLVAFDAVML